MWVLLASHSFVNTNNSAVDGAGMHHILQIIDDKWNPRKADPNDEEQNNGYHPGHGPTLVVDFSGHLQNISCSVEWICPPH